MAIDTKEKRLSIMNMGCPWRGVLIDPVDSSVQGERQILYFYSGILWQSISGRRYTIYAWG